MALGVKPVKTLTGSIAFLAIAFLVMAPVAVLLARVENSAGIGPAGWAAVRFTVMQAGLSALISIALAVPVARALARRQFRGRALMLSLIGAPFILPALVAVFGLLAIWGRSGVVSQALAWLGLPVLDIYGLPGVLLAHVFFNLPLATRLLLQGWSAVPAEQFRLLAQLGATPRDTFHLIERPILRATLPGAFLVIFLFCIGSFAVVLALGGGPGATTVELAIYQALRFSFDLPAAAMLAMVQLALALGVTLVALVVARPAGFGAGALRVQQRWDDAPWARRLDAGLLVTLALFLGLPLLAVLGRGLTGAWPDGLAWALGRSVAVALSSTVLALALGLSLASLIDARRGPVGKGLETLTYLVLAASPFVIGTGLFIILNPYISPARMALPVTVLVNAALTVPIALRVFLPALARTRTRTARLADGLGIAGMARLRYVVWPEMRAEIGFFAGLAAALSMGDLGVITLFAPPDLETLPLLMSRLMGSYRMEQAATVGLVLVAGSFALFWAFDKGGAHGRNTRQA